MKLRRHLPLLAGVAALALIYGAASIRYADQNFLSLAVFINLISDRSFLGIVAVGMTFVILSGGIDLSVGAVMGLSSILIATLMTHHGWPFVPAVLAALAAGTSLGAAMGAIIHYARIRAFIVTLAGMFLARGIAFLIHLEPVAIADPTHAAVSSWGIPFGGDNFLPVTAVALLAVTAAGTYIATLTPFGLNVRAIGGDEDAARLMGVNIARTRIGVYTLSGLCAALAGAVLTLYLSSGNHIEGVGLELDAIAAVVIGGTLLSGGVGTVPGTLVGVLIIGVIVNVITTYEGGFSSGSTKLAIAGLLLVFVVLQRLLAGRRRD